MLIKSALYFPLLFLVWFTVILYTSPGLSLAKLLIVIVLSIISALLANMIIDKTLKTLTVLGFYMLSAFWFLILPFPFAASKVSSWYWLGGYHIVQGKGSDIYARYQYNHTWSVPLLIAVSLILGAVCCYIFTKTTHTLKTKSQA